MLCLSRRKSWKKLNFYVLSTFKGTGMKSLGVTFLGEFNFDLFFNYIDTSNISIFLPENMSYINIYIAYKL